MIFLMLILMRTRKEVMPIKQLKQISLFLFFGIIFLGPSCFCAKKGEGFTLHKGLLRSALCVPIKLEKSSIKALVTIAEDKERKLWDLNSGKCVQSLKNVTHDPICLASVVDSENDENTVVISGSTDGSVKFFLPINDTCEKKEIWKHAKICALETINDKRICVGASDGSLSIVTSKNNALNTDDLPKGCAAVSFLRYIGENNVVVAFGDGGVKVLNIIKKEWGPSIFFTKDLIVAIEALSNKKLLICLKSGLWSWDLVQKNKSEVSLHQQTAWPISTFLKWDATTFIVGCVDGSCYCYDSAKDALSFLKKVHKCRIVSLARDYNTLIVAFHDGCIEQFDLNGKPCGKSFQCASPVDEDGDEELFEIE